MISQYYNTKSMKKIINDDNLEYNVNTTDNITLDNITHYLGTKFPPIPYLWHYDDFTQPYPVYGIKKINVNDLKKLIQNDQMGEFNNINTDVYILAQYKDHKVMYNELSNEKEIYLAHHTWLYNNLTKKDHIPNEKISLNFKYLTGINEIVGSLGLYEHYPYKNEKKKASGGIPLNGKLELRQSTIHYHKGHIKFSGINCNNFNQLSDNCVFMSIIKYPALYTKNGRTQIQTPSKKSNCIVLHIFRNVYDNNPNDAEYQQLIDKYLK